MKHYTAKKVPGADAISMMKNSFDLLIDSDAFVGWIFPSDFHFEKSRSLFHKIESERLKIACTNLVITETATVLSHRQDQKLARFFLETIDKLELPIIRINQELENKALQLFFKQNKRGTSFTDCANAVVIQEFAIPKIFSFDKAYKNQYKVELFDLT